MTLRAESARGVALAWLVATGGLGLGGCASPHSNREGGGERPVAASGPVAPPALSPEGAGGGRDMAGDGLAPGEGDGAAPIILNEPGDVDRRVAFATVIDTRTIPQRIDPDVPSPLRRRVREVLPPHEGVKFRMEQPALDEVQGAMLEGDERRTDVQGAFPAIVNTGWTPPDPTLAVGPDHAVVTVNSSIAIYTKAGTRSFIADLGSPGNPGFFEPQGAATFAFDPKCFYDHFSQRFVVVALEVYGTTQSWVNIAVSDDSDPNGVWYKYRTNGVIAAGTTNYWWDYPGLGADAQAIYVVGNLYGLNVSGFGGVGVRVFDKAPMLTGQPVVFSTLRNANSASAQVARVYGTGSRIFFGSFAGNTSIRIETVNNPLTAPTLASTTVSIPAFGGAPGAPSGAGFTVNVIDPRAMNVAWRNGRLYMTHSVGVSGRALARWYIVNTSSWPNGGTPTLGQSGDVNIAPNVHTYFPAIGVNGADAMALIFNQSSTTQNSSVSIAARLTTDPTGRVAAPQVVKPGEDPFGGRWGDYYGLEVDPTDDATFWGVGEYQALGGSWRTWIARFTTGQFPSTAAFADSVGNLLTVSPTAVDVLANDTPRIGPGAIQSFDATTALGGTVVRSIGTGPGGRDRLVYTPPSALVTGIDTFAYVLRDGGTGETASATVSANLYSPADFRSPDILSGTTPALNARYFELVPPYPDQIPNFDALAPYRTVTIPQLNWAATPLEVLTSLRSDGVGAVFDGVVLVPSDGLYAFSITSDEGSKFFLGGQWLINNDGRHAMVEQTSAPIGLKAGTHRIRVEYFEADGDAGLILKWRTVAPVSGTFAPIPATSLARPLPCNDIDFNNDGVFPDLLDVSQFLEVFGGANCPAQSCDSIDVNGDSVFPDIADILKFFDLFGGGAC
jgi:hypothetical protein